MPRYEGRKTMATFVLVHGSWAGSVVWRELAPRLRKAGHDVYAPTLTGIGARKHLLSREIDLNTHIQDVIGVIDDADLSDMGLVGNSYGGMDQWRSRPRAGESCLARLSRRLRAGERTILIEPVAARPASCHPAGRGLVGSAANVGGLRPITRLGPIAAPASLHAGPGQSVTGICAKIPNASICR
jgi:pimeloyl-ACP methyl ester carboxylesterase